jgi:hypothetical protein
MRPELLAAASAAAAAGRFDDAVETLARLRGLRYRPERGLAPRLDPRQDL